MKTSFAPNAVSLLVSIFVTFGAVKAIADYAYPKAASTQLACASCRVHLSTAATRRVGT